MVPNMPQSHDALAVQMRKTFLGFILLPFCLYTLPSQGEMVQLKQHQQHQEELVGWWSLHGGLAG